MFVCGATSGCRENRDTILRDAGEKFKELREEKWRVVAEELHNEDCHQFIRAYTAGGITGEGYFNCGRGTLLITGSSVLSHVFRENP